MRFRRRELRIGSSYIVLFRNVNKEQFAVCTKTTSWFLWSKNCENQCNSLALSTGSSPSERNSLSVERCW